MGSSFLSPTPATQTTLATSNKQYQPGDINAYMNYQGVLGGPANAQYQEAINNYVYPGQRVGGPTDLMSQYFGQADKRVVLREAEAIIQNRLDRAIAA